jgi:hypothetical protein
MVSGHTLAVADGEGRKAECLTCEFRLAIGGSALCWSL